MLETDYKNIKEGNNLICFNDLSTADNVKCYVFEAGKVYKVDKIVSYGLSLSTDSGSMFVKKENILKYFHLPEDISKVCHPSHYTWLKELCGIEVIDICRHLNFNTGNVIKYVLRGGHKSENGYTIKEKQIEDYKKAIFYLKDEIRRLKNS